MLEISIIIRTKNEEKWLDQCLNILSTQSYNNFEILIIDSGSTDKTLEIAKKYNTRILKIKSSDFNYPYTLNFGCKNANAIFGKNTISTKPMGLAVKMEIGPIIGLKRAIKL
jgi:glycosyltransferase involved in cell wall biosynthesis